MTESDLRWAAATAVLRLAAHHPPVIEELRRLAGAGNGRAATGMALYCLRDLAQAGPDAQAVYLTSLSDPDSGVRLAGLSCLGKLKLASSEAGKALLRLVEADPDRACAALPRSRSASSVMLRLRCSRC